MECRVRIAHLTTTEAGQVLESDCTDPTLGLVCRDSNQPMEGPVTTMKSDSLALPLQVGLPIDDDNEDGDNDG